MLKVLIATILLLPTFWLTCPKSLSTTTTTHSLLIALTTLTWLKWTSETRWTSPNTYMATDPLSTPHLVLTCWLLPLMILASQNHISPEPISRQRTHIILLGSLLTFSIFALSATEDIIFYIMFEATVIRTLIIVTGWGNQTERLTAGSYFLIYTVAGSLRLLVALLLLLQSTRTLPMLVLQYSQPLQLKPWGHMIWWAGCLLAFLVKMPLYGVHLWLPNAHVDAPAAGSMVLAAVVLNLAGYGLLRMIVMLDPVSNELAYPFVIFALRGFILTRSIWLRQTHLKSLMAYSSVGLMGLVAGGIVILTAWGFWGAIILMIGHGLASSALFCVAITASEGTLSRTMVLAGGLLVFFPLTAVWCFIAILANSALPPLPNVMGQLIIITSLFNWSPWTFVLSGLATLITASYSVYLFLMSLRGPTPKHITGLEPYHSRDHLVITMLLMPIIVLVTKPELIWGWCY
uniref:NADH-ubiquinone oxidoreductase chain 4 n=1 Tax=Acrossocheilus paradoxus TaxID=76593 RepID=A0A125R6X2_ACRPD|nr:NADH dehydrogenase subunit 4 [Acrossocheilus paradoxus]AMD11929.1 NADH dehydrogenase subunit 4 [Acrossocheilus paradoxus]